MYQVLLSLSAPSLRGVHQCNTTFPALRAFYLRGFGWRWGRDAFAMVKPFFPMRGMTRLWCMHIVRRIGMKSTQELIRHASLRIAMDVCAGGHGGHEERAGSGTRMPPPGQELVRNLFDYVIAYTQIKTPCARNIGQQPWSQYLSEMPHRETIQFTPPAIARPDAFC
jgi:hypothetical protein